MTYSTSDDLDRPGRAWPEPLVFDVVEAAYGPMAEDRTDAVRVAVHLHARFLRALLDGETDRSGALRIELIACCAARGIASQTIAAADLAVFRELNTIIEHRFRNSPRQRLAFLQRVHDAIGTLTRRHAASADKPAQRHVARPAPAAERRLALTD